MRNGSVTPEQAAHPAPRPAVLHDSAVAARACDAHVHVFDPARFAYAPQRRFTPAPARVDALAAHLSRLGLGRVVLVQASVYGTDNRCLVDALEHLGDRARGVAVVDEHTGTAELDRLHQAGVRAARVNLAVDRLADPASAWARIEAANRLVPGDWHIQLHAGLVTLTALAPSCDRLPRVFSIDHYGLPHVPSGVEQPLWRDLCAWLRSSGRVYVKLSAPYQVCGQEPGYEPMEPFVRSLVEAAPDRLVWGSDWPHTAGARRTGRKDPSIEEPFRSEDDALILANVAAWLGSDEQVRRVLVENPATLYGYDAVTG